METRLPLETARANCFFDKGAARVSPLCAGALAATSRGTKAAMAVVELIAAAHAIATPSLETNGSHETPGNGGVGEQSRV